MPGHELPCAPKESDKNGQVVLDRAKKLFIEHCPSGLQVQNVTPSVLAAGKYTCVWTVTYRKLNQFQDYKALRRNLKKRRPFSTNATIDAKSLRVEYGIIHCRCEQAKLPKKPGEKEKIEEDEKWEINENGEKYQNGEEIENGVQVGKDENGDEDELLLLQMQLIEFCHKELISLRHGEEDNNGEENELSLLLLQMKEVCEWLITLNRRKISANRWHVRSKNEVYKKYI